MKRRLARAVLAALVILSIVPRHVIATDEMPSVTDHMALAAMYAGEAKTLRAKAASHQLMLERYDRATLPSKGIAFPKAALVQHCRRLVASYSDAAKQAEELAKTERELARANPGQP